MKTSVKYYENNNWLIGESFFNEEWLGKYESIFTQGNGYMGIRGAIEESYLNEKRNTFVAGTFNKFDEFEVTELPNVADMLNLNFRINGQVFNLSKGKIISYERILNLKNGEIIRDVIWEIETGITVKLSFKRFVSMDDLHLIVQEVSITPLDSDIQIEIVSAIDGEQTNTGSQHFHEGEKRLFDGDIMQMVPQTTESKIDFVLQNIHELFVDGEKVTLDSRVEMHRRKIQMIYWGEIKENNTLVVLKKNSIYTSRDKDHEDLELEELKSLALNEIRELRDVTYDTLLDKSAEAWSDKVWSKANIKIDSDNFIDELAINFARYHLHVMTPAHDSRMNIGAKGLSGEGYKGHTFWDTEIFMLPYYIYTYPKIARSLLEYRYLGLNGARRKAQENGYEGAQYPWEAAWIEDGETTPVWGAADIVTGKATKIWSGFIEQHITSDVAYGVLEYYQATQDQEFMDSMGYEIIFETSKFWNSRLEWNEDKEEYHINEVIGPDEYKEHIDNNAFTNYTAKWNMETAIEIYEELKEINSELLETLHNKFGVHELYKSLLDKVNKIYIPEPNQDGIIPQDDTYLSKEIIDLTPYKEHDLVGTLFHDYNLDQVNEMQITKQSDVLLLIFLFEHLFNNDIKKKNWDYYEPKTMHDSSLSLSTHSALAADLGEIEMAYEFFDQAKNIDMGPVMKSSDAGIHAASLGGIWQMVVFGFGGVRALDGQLRINPHLPKNWQGLAFEFNWHQDKLKVEVKDKELYIENITQNKPVKFTCRDKEYTVVDSLKIEL